MFMVSGTTVKLAPAGRAVLGPTAVVCQLFPQTTKPRTPSNEGDPGFSVFSGLSAVSAATT